MGATSSIQKAYSKKFKEVEKYAKSLTGFKSICVEVRQEEKEESPFLFGKFIILRFENLYGCYIRVFYDEDSKKFEYDFIVVEFYGEYDSEYFRSTSNSITTSEYGCKSAYSIEELFEYIKLVSEFSCDGRVERYDAMRQDTLKGRIVEEKEKNEGHLTIGQLEEILFEFDVDIWIPDNLKDVKIC